MLRSRVALELALLPLFLLFLWCLDKAFTPERRLEDRTYRDKKSS
jgi:hypothetical protein